jgi:tetratricopeptide (TPR) repeat protein
LDEYHPDKDALESFARGEILAETERWILEHLRSGCPICQRTIDALLPSLEALPTLEAREPVLPLQVSDETDSIPLHRPTGKFSGPPAPAMSSSLLSTRSTRSTPQPSGTAAPAASTAKRNAASYVRSPASTGAARPSQGNPRRRAAIAFEPARGNPGSSSSGAAGRTGMAQIGGNCGDVRHPDAGDDCGGDAWRDRAGARRGHREGRDVENEAWDRIFANLEQRLVLVAAERAAAPRLLSDLLQRPAAEWSTLVHASRPFQSLALCDLLLDRSFETGGYDSSEAIALAQLGILVADHLDTRHYGSAVVHDMKARAWAYLGNARRIAADFFGAEQALAFAEALAEDGSADPLEEARLVDLKALLLSDQGWFEEAAELLDTVIEIYEDVQDLHRKGRALISKGICLGHSGWPRAAADLILQGLAQLDREVEPRLALTARHELAWFLAECGHCDQAQRQLDSVRKDLLSVDDARTELRLERLETRIAHRSGRWPEAEHRLDSLLQRCVAGGLGYEAALVMLDLTSLHLEQGKRAEICRLAEEVLPVVLSLDIHRQAAAALLTFQQAAQGDRMTRALVNDIAAYLQRARKNPRLSFQLAA